MADIDLFHHVKDGTRIDTFETIGWGFSLPGPEAFPPFLQPLFPYGFTKFMLLEVIAAVLVVILVVPVVRRLRTGDPPRGVWANAVEGLLLFLRDEVARPAIPDKYPDHHGDPYHGDPHRAETPHAQAREGAGGAYGAPGVDLKPDTIVHRADYYMPLLWTLFLFILFCNLLGMLPFSGSPTASIVVTGVLSLITFVVIHVAGVINNGFSGYLKSFVPHIEGDDTLMKILKPFIVVGVTAIEILSLFIRNIVLAIRLFANMVGGHTALFLMLLFIQIVGTSLHPYAGYLFWPVTAGSVVLVVLMSVLELFIALLQAYVFTMLTATFIGLAVAPEH
jgi:F-type H+-transporting ATPase subunit a